MTDATIWTVIAGLGIATYLIRVSFLGLLGGRDVPPGLVRALGFVPAAVIPALVAPMVLSLDGGRLEAEASTVIACLATLVAGASTRSVMAAILTGAATAIAATLLVG